MGIYPEKATILKDACTSLFTGALFTIARIWKQPRCPSTGEWMKLRYIHTMKCYSAIKKKKEFETVLVRWMNLESVTQSKSEREKHILYVNA